MVIISSCTNVVQSNCPMIITNIEVIDNEDGKYVYDVTDCWIGFTLYTDVKYSIGDTLWIY